MNNFFYDNADYALFKKAMRKTGGEPVVINILSSDSSLKPKEDKPVEKKSQYNNFASRQETSTFGRFFGPQKKRTAPVDTNSFASWKNKNYRKTEQTIEEKENSPFKFSLSDYMNEKFGKTKFNELDEAKSNLQKPINQLSTEDPQYKKFSLDSFMSKLEQQRKVEEELKENDDILAPIGSDAEKIVPDSSQDEDFGFGSETTVETVAFDDGTVGDRFSIDKSELEKIKSRLQKIEEEQENIKKRGNEKVIEGNELSSLASDDDFDLEKLGFEPIEEEAESASDETNVTEETEVSDNEVETEEKEANQSEETNDETTDENDTEHSKEKSESIVDQISERLDRIEEESKKEDKSESETLAEESNVEENVSVVEENSDENKKDSPVTKADMEKISDNFMQKFAKLYKKNEQNENIVDDFDKTIEQSNKESVLTESQEASKNKEQDELAKKYAIQQAELEAKILELIESNKQTDKKAEERLKQIELEKKQAEEAYNMRLREIEESYNRKYEEYKKRAYLGKLSDEAKIKSLEQNIVSGAEESIAKRKGKKTSLKKELKTNLEKSNIEMDKKLLELASSLNKNEQIKHRRQTVKVSSLRTGELPEMNIVSKPAINVDTVVKPKKTRKKKSSRRRIDGDIISDIDFD